MIWTFFQIMDFDAIDFSQRCFLTRFAYGVFVEARFLTPTVPVYGNKLKLVMVMFLPFIDKPFHDAIRQCVRKSPYPKRNPRITHLRVNTVVRGLFPHCLIKTGVRKPVVWGRGLVSDPFSAGALRLTAALLVWRSSLYVTMNWLGVDHPK